MPRIVDHEEQRRELLDRSFALFADKGYGGVTMRGLARALGVSTGTLYHYFEGKPDIFSQMLGQLAARDIAEVEATVGPDDGLPERLAALSTWIEAKAPYLRRLLLLALDAWRLDPTPEARARLTGISRTYRDALVERLSLSSDTLGSLLYSLILGALAHQTLDEDAGALGPQLDLASRLIPLLG